VIGVNLSEPLERVQAYAAEMKLTFPLVIDPDGALARTYGVRFTPTHFLIDRSGVVRAGGAGARDWDGQAARAAMAILLEPTPLSILPARPDRADPPPNRRPERR
jgi:peroxiredoxin